MKRSMFFAVALVLGSALATSGTLHLQLTNSAPKKDETVTEPPAEIQLWFNQEISLPVSRVALTGPDREEVEMGDATATDDPKSFKASVNATLSPGLHTVSWRTAGDDGHIVRGEFNFTFSSTQAR